MGIRNGFRYYILNHLDVELTDRNANLLESALNIQLEDLMNLFIASIAKEELGLAHIINAEG